MGLRDASVSKNAASVILHLIKITEKLPHFGFDTQEEEMLFQWDRWEMRRMSLLQVIYHILRSSTLEISELLG